MSSAEARAWDHTSPSTTEVETGARTVRRSSALLVALVCMAVGGFVFTAIAARSVDRTELGVHASLLFWVLLLNQVTSMGLPVVVSRLGRFSAEAVQRWVFTAACAITVASSVIGAALFGWLGVSSLRQPVQDVVAQHGRLLTVGVVAVIVAGLSLTLLAEIRLVAVGLSRWVVVRAVTANIIRVGLLLVPQVRRDPFWLVVANLGPNAALGAVASLFLVGRRGTRTPPVRPELTVEARVAGINWVTIAAVQAPQFAVPVIVGLSADSNAAFYLAWQIMTVVFLVPVVVGHVVVVESAGRSPQVLVRAVATGVAVSLTVTAVAALLSVPLGRWTATLLFGDAYEDAARLLTPLLLAAVPWSITAVLLAATRTTDRVLPTILVATSFAIPTLSIPLLVGPEDAVAAVWWWLAANVVAACCAAMCFEATVRVHGGANPELSS